MEHRSPSKGNTITVMATSPPRHRILTPKKRHDSGYMENQDLSPVRCTSRSTSPTKRPPRPNGRRSHPDPAPSSAHQFFHFPTPHTLTSPPGSARSDRPHEVVPPPPPPPTCHYWTSDRTRRLEYAAIDAASRGFKGYALKLVPDCFLGAEHRHRRRGFWCERDRRRRRDSQCGSVRRYRLEMELEEEDSGSRSMMAEKGVKSVATERISRAGWRFWR